jgi:cytochrome P450
VAELFVIPNGPWFLLSIRLAAPLSSSPLPGLLSKNALYLKLANVKESAAPPESLDGDYFQNPLAFYARMRAEGPVTQVQMPDLGSSWLITRYDEVRSALADPRLHKDWSHKLQPEDWVPDPLTSFLNVHLLNLDPPDHTRLRKLVSKAFTARRVAGLRPRVEAITTGLLDAMAARAAAGETEMDLIDAFAFPLPITVICELVGIPVSDQDQFKSWSHAIVASVISQEEVYAAATGMYKYFTELIAAKRKAPDDDLLSALITARDDNDSLDEQELLAMMFLLLVAGHETTANLIASGTLALLTHPDELARLRSDPALLPGAVEELLRFVNPVNHATERFTLEPTEIGGVTIPARQWVLCVTSSANHDPARFTEPDRLDLSRDTGGHLAFGHGIHYCLGAPLARLEGEVAFGALLARFPSLALAVPASTLRWRRSSLIHGLESLPVRLR